MTITSSLNIKHFTLTLPLNKSSQKGCMAPLLPYPKLILLNINFTMVHQRPSRQRLHDDWFNCRVIQVTLGSNDLYKRSSLATANCNNCTVDVTLKHRTSMDDSMLASWICNIIVCICYCCKFNTTIHHDDTELANGTTLDTLDTLTVTKRRVTFATNVT